MIVLFIAIWSLLAPPGQAQEVSTPGLSALVDLARTRNPDIVAARKNWEMVQAKVLAEKTWPAPEVGIEYWGVPRSGLSVGSAPERWYDVSQTIPFPGKLSLRGRAAGHEARREEEIYHVVERDVLAQVKEAYYGLLLAQHTAKVYDDTVDILRRFANIAESKYAVGKTSQPNVLKAQVELSKMMNLVIAAHQQIEIARARLNALLDRHPEEPLSAEEDPKMDVKLPTLEELQRLALDNRPEVHAASHHVNHMRAELAAKRSDYLPDFMAQYSLRTREGQPNDSIAMLKMTLPFVWFWRQRSIVRSTEFEKEHADAMLESAKIKADYDVKDTLVQVQTARRLVELYKTTILPQTEQSLRVSEASYRTDRLGFLDLLDAERGYVDSQLEYDRAVSDYGSRLAQLERVVGVDLSAGQPSEVHPHEH